MRDGDGGGGGDGLVVPSDGPVEGDEAVGGP